MTNSSASQISSFYSQSRANYLYSQVLRTPRLFELFKKSHFGICCIFTRKWTAAGCGPRQIVGKKSEMAASKIDTSRIRPAINLKISKYLWKRATFNGAFDVNIEETVGLKNADIKLIFSNISLRSEDRKEDRVSCLTCWLQIEFILRARRPLKMARHSRPGQQVQVQTFTDLTSRSEKKNGDCIFVSLTTLWRKRRVDLRCDELNVR